MVPKQIIYPINYWNALVGRPSVEVETRKFQATMARLLGRDVAALPLGRARMGLYLLARHAIASGRRQIVLSPYTIPDVVNMICLAGAQPVFVDCALRSTNVDLEHLEELLKGDVAAVLLTHFHVNQAACGTIKRLCQEKGVLLFEDCAIALWGVVEGRHVGTTSDGAILSLSGFKSLNYFWGGCVFSRHQEMIATLAEETDRWQRLRRADYLQQLIKTAQYDVATRKPFFDWAVFPMLKRRQKRSSEAVNLAPPRLESVEIDRTLTSLPSASALAEWNSKLEATVQYLGHRKEIAAIYDAYFANRMVSAETDAEARAASSFINYPLYVGHERRNVIYKNLLLNGYDIGASLYPNCHEHEKFADAPGKSDRVADLVRSVITLPTHPGVTPSYARSLAEKVAKEMRH